MEQNKEHGESFMIRLSRFIVDKRNLIFLVFGLALVFSAFSRNWTKVEMELVAYLPSDSETRRGIDIMDEQFITFGSANVMVANITYGDAEALSHELEQLDGVDSVSFDDTTDHYNQVSALYGITFDYAEDDERSLIALDRVKEHLASYDTYISTELGNQDAEIIDQEVSVIMVLVALIVVTVLVLTSQTYAEVPVLLITFVTAMILNLGSNFLLGKISFVSNSVTSILQLALSLDYAIILCNRFKDEHRSLPIREACITALSKAIPEISASCLTTLGGLTAMLFMQFRLGGDMAICLIKAIAFALLSVFVLMPGLLMLFGPLMDRTRHRNFLPDISFVGRFDHATRYIVPPVFLVTIIVASMLSRSCPYVYGYGSIKTPKENFVQVADRMISSTFTSPETVAVVLPGRDYAKEKEYLDRLETFAEVDHTLGLANAEAMDGYMLTDRLTPRQFAELTDIDYELAQLVYTAYAAENDEYGSVIGGLSTYGVPLMDMLLFVCDKIDSGIVSLDDEQKEKLTDAADTIRKARQQLEGPDFIRALVYLRLKSGNNETYKFLDSMRDMARELYPDQEVYLAGNLTNEYDFMKSFAVDNIVVTVVSILIVLLVLLFTFKSAGMPVLLILVIQGSIWINFAIPALTGKPLFFLGYLIVSAIQMGANIDYAIVIASRYMEVKDRMDRREAAINTMNFAFPTIITSGTILCIAGVLIGSMTSECTIVGIGQSIGRGTIISIILVMFVLPQILLIGGDLIARTSFSGVKLLRVQHASGNIAVDGHVTGHINGNVTGYLRGTVEGESDLRLLTGHLEPAGKEDL